MKKHSLFLVTLFVPTISVFAGEVVDKLKPLTEQQKKDIAWAKQENQRKFIRPFLEKDLVDALMPYAQDQINKARSNAEARKFQRDNKHEPQPAVCIFDDEKENWQRDGVESALRLHRGCNVVLSLLHHLNPGMVEYETQLHNGSVTFGRFTKVFTEDAYIYLTKKTDIWQRAYAKAEELLKDENRDDDPIDEACIGLDIFYSSPLVKFFDSCKKRLFNRWQDQVRDKHWNYDEEKAALEIKIEEDIKEREKIVRNSTDSNALKIAKRELEYLKYSPELLKRHEQYRDEINRDYGFDTFKDKVFEDTIVELFAAYISSGKNNDELVSNFVEIFYDPNSKEWIKGEREKFQQFINFFPEFVSEAYDEEIVNMWRIQVSALDFWKKATEYSRNNLGTRPPAFYCLDNAIQLLKNYVAPSIKNPQFDSKIKPTEYAWFWYPFACIIYDTDTVVLSSSYGGSFFHWIQKLFEKPAIVKLIDEVEFKKSKAAADIRHPWLSEDKASYYFSDTAASSGELCPKSRHELQRDWTAFYDATFKSIGCETNILSDSVLPAVSYLNDVDFKYVRLAVHECALAIHEFQQAYKYKKEDDARPKDKEKKVMIPPVNLFANQKAHLLEKFCKLINLLAGKGIPWGKMIPKSAVLGDNECIGEYIKSHLNLFTTYHTHTGAVVRSLLLSDQDVITKILAGEGKTDETKKYDKDVCSKICDASETYEEALLNVMSAKQMCIEYVEKLHDINTGNDQTKFKIDACNKVNDLASIYVNMKTNDDNAKNIQDFFENTFLITGITDNTIKEKRRKELKKLFENYYKAQIVLSKTVRNYYEQIGNIEDVNYKHLS